MAHFEFGQDRLAQPHPLQAFELAQRSVESPLEARFVTGKKSGKLACLRLVVPIENLRLERILAN